MPALDSFQTLAESIQRALRSDIAGPVSAEQLAESIDHIMLEESRAGELGLAYIRVVVVAPYVALTWWTFVGHSTPQLVARALHTTVWLIAAIALVLALRRGWYRS